jgi:TonB family protein
MPTSDLQVGTGSDNPAGGGTQPQEELYQVTFVESPNLLLSIVQQIRSWLREPKITVPRQYYRGESTLPVTEMRPWYRDIPNQVKALRQLFRKPTDPIGIYNRQQAKKRFAVALLVGAAGSAVGGYVWGLPGNLLSLIVGFILGMDAGRAAFKKLRDPGDIWRDYAPQDASWRNSVLVHVMLMLAIWLPYELYQMATPVKASSTFEIVDISPYLDQLAGPDEKTGGGGGGGDRSPTPASQGAVPKFAKQQLAPPAVVVPEVTPQLPVQPNLLGPPELKLPEMAMNMPWGDPQGVLGDASSGPGFGGGIGSGEGGGIGSGKGGGLGPGEGGGFGGGIYSVGGNVTAPIPIYKPEPPYSEEARKAKYQGTVVLWIIVDAHGNVTDLRVVKPLGLGLDDKAVETVRTWKFKPAMRNNIPVPVRVGVEVSFRLF